MFALRGVTLAARLMSSETRPRRRSRALSGSCCLLSEGTLAAVRMKIAPARPAAVAETPMVPSLMKSAMEATEPAAAPPGRGRARSESGGAESGGRDESDADLAKHNDLLRFRDVGSAASCPIGGEA